MEKEKRKPIVKKVKKIVVSGQTDVTNKDENKEGQKQSIRVS